MMINTHNCYGGGLSWPIFTLLRRGTLFLLSSYWSGNIGSRGNIQHALSSFMIAMIWEEIINKIIISVHMLAVHHSTFYMEHCPSHPQFWVIVYVTEDNVWCSLSSHSFMFVPNHMNFRCSVNLPSVNLPCAVLVSHNMFHIPLKKAFPSLYHESSLLLI